MTLHPGRATKASLEFAAPRDLGLCPDGLGRIRPRLQEMVDAGEIPGAVVMVARRGRVALAEAVGWSDAETHAPLGVDALLRIHSMTKPVTSVAALQLIERGLLSWEDPVEKHLPTWQTPPVLSPDGAELRPAARSITVADLLRHTSGLTYGDYAEPALRREYQRLKPLRRDSSLSVMAGELQELPLHFQPGEGFHYGVSTDLLGRVIEAASGRPFAAQLDEAILQPLGMRDTAFHVPEEKLDRLAALHAPGRSAGSWRVTDRAADTAYRLPPGLPSGGGGLISTAADYMRFCLCLADGGRWGDVQLLRGETVAALAQNQLPASAYPIVLGRDRRLGVGFGWGFSVVVEKTRYTRRSEIGEYGWGGSACTHFWITPSQELAVVALAQQAPFTFRLEMAVKSLVAAAIR